MDLQCFWQGSVIGGVSCWGFGGDMVELWRMIVVFLCVWHFACCTLDSSQWWDSILPCLEPFVGFVYIQGRVQFMCICGLRHQQMNDLWCTVIACMLLILIEVGYKLHNLGCVFFATCCRRMFCRSLLAMCLCWPGAPIKFSMFPMRDFCR